MVAMIIAGIVSFFGIAGIMVFATNAVAPLTGVFLGLFTGIILWISAWLLVSAVATVAGLQKNEEGFFECKDWWRKWNEYIAKDDKRGTIPKDSCRFYQRTVNHMGWSPVFCILIPVIIIIAIVINLVSGRVPNLRSLTFEEEIPSNKICKFTKEYYKFSPITMYGIIGIYFLFRCVYWHAEI